MPWSSGVETGHQLAGHGTSCAAWPSPGPAAAWCRGKHWNAASSRHRHDPDAYWTLPAGARIIPPFRTRQIFGGGARLDGIDALASEFFVLPARIGTPMHVGGLTETTKNPAYATAVGLVLFGAKQDSGAQAKDSDRKGVWTRMTSWFSELIG